MLANITRWNTSVSNDVVLWRSTIIPSPEMKNGNNTYTSYMIITGTLQIITANIQ